MPHPAPNVIPPGGYLVLTENDWNDNPASTNGFRLDSHGEEIYLYAADAASANGTKTRPAMAAARVNAKVFVPKL